MKRYLIYAFTGLLLASCGKEELPETGTNDLTADREIRFEIGIVPPPSDLRFQTRVATDDLFKCAWEVGDTIALFAFKEGATIPSEDYYIKGVNLIYDGESWSPETPLYWPVDGKKLCFYACYPHTAMEGVKDFNFDVKANQNMETYEQSNLSLSDLMLTSGDWTAKGKPIDLVFSQHYVCMMQVTLDDPHRMIQPDETVTVKLRGLRRSAPIKFQSDGWSAQWAIDEGDVTMRRVEQPGDADYHERYTFRAIIPKQTIFSGTCLYRIAIGNAVFTSSPLKANFSVMINNAYLFTEVIPSY